MIVRTRGYLRLTSALEIPIDLVAYQMGQSGRDA